MQITKPLYRAHRAPVFAGYDGADDDEPRESVVPKKLVVRSMVVDSSFADLEAIFRKARMRDAVADDVPGVDCKPEAPQGLSLSKLLKFGSVSLAVVCAESLALFAVGYPEMGVLNPFAAVLFLVASPFFYWMGRLARY